MMDLFNLSYNIANIHAGTYSCDLRKCWAFKNKYLTGIHISI